VATRKVEQEIEALTLLRDAPAEEAQAALRKALSDRVNLIVAKAAKISAERQFQDLVPDLLQAFDRLMEKPAERDPQCWGKNAVAAALKDMEYSLAAPFLRGAHHVQMEPVYGGHADTAESLRGTCLLALVACADLERGDALRCFVNALTERSHVIRLEAARALGQMQGEESALVLRFKALLGDEDPEVSGQVFDSLLSIEGELGLEFVAGFLKRGGARAEEAALAIGSSRLRVAFAVLKETWAAARDPEFREVVLRAVSAVRNEAAIGWLLEQVRHARIRDAVAAIHALSLHKGSEEVRGQVQSAVEEREQEVQNEYRREFGC
jgi:hypothetical protein